MLTENLPELLQDIHNVILIQASHRSDENLGLFIRGDYLVGISLLPRIWMISSTRFGCLSRLVPIMPFADSTPLLSQLAPL